jgi:hypothetical protein
MTLWIFRGENPTLDEEYPASLNPQRRAGYSSVKSPHHIAAFGRTGEPFWIATQANVDPYWLRLGAIQPCILAVERSNLDGLPESSQTPVP